MTFIRLGMWAAFAVVFIWSSFGAFAQSLDDLREIAKEQGFHKLPDETLLELKEEARTLKTPSQQVVETMVPALASALGMFPLIGMSFDHLAHQKTEFAINSLFRGLGVHMFSTLPDEVTLLAVGNVFGKNDETDMDRLSTSLIAGASSGIVAAPIELLMTQQRYHKKGFSETLSLLQKKHGTGALTTGMSAIALRNMVSATGLFWVPSLIAPILPKISDDETIQGSLGVAVGGAVMGMANQPFEVARGFIQRTVPERGQRGPNILDAWKDRYKAGGIRELWRGASYGAMIIGGGYVMIDFTRRLLDKHHTKNNVKELLAQKPKDFGQQVDSYESQQTPNAPLWRSLEPTPSMDISRTPLWKVIAASGTMTRSQNERHL